MMSPLVLKRALSTTVLNASVIGAASCAPSPVVQAPARGAATADAMMVRLPATDFIMGVHDGYDGEKPAHRVHVDAFEMDQVEVTTEAYQACVTTGACAAAKVVKSCNGGKADKARHPINCVAFDEAVAYCAWRGKRLPTQEEWEYGARGTDGRHYPWGNEEPTSQLCWRRWDSKDTAAAQGTCPVDSFAAGRSPFGLDDMAGNVWEWTSSLGEGTKRVVRGGSWANFSPASARAALHSVTDEPSYRGVDLGFRCAGDLPREGAR